MMKSACKYFAKIVFLLVLAFLATQVLVTKVVYPQSPQVRFSFKNAVRRLPAQIGLQAKKIAQSPSAPSLPPPWIADPIKPTIIAQPPPPYHPSTSTPQVRPTTALPTPTNPPESKPSPTPISTLLPPEPTPTFVSPAGALSQLAQLINQERQKNGIASLSFNGALMQAAQVHADDMVQNGYFSHTGRDGSTPADRAQKAGYGSSWVGENIARGSGSPSNIFSMWMKSSGHRRNMLNPQWRSAGIGVSSTTWVLLLGAK